MRTRSTFASLLCLPLLACGGGGGAGGGGVVIDAPNNQIDGPANVACPIADSLGSPTFGSADQGAVVDPPTGSDTITETTWFGDTGTGSAQVEIHFVALSGGGAGSGSDPGTPDWPTSLGPKSAIDFSTAPDAFGVILADIDQSSGVPGALYFTADGTLTLTNAGSAIGATFAGNASDVDFIHVDLDSSGHITGQDPDNCSTNLASATFSATVMADPNAIVASPGSMRDHQIDAAVAQFIRNRKH